MLMSVWNIVHPAHFFTRCFVVNHYDDVTANNYYVVIVTYFAERPVYPPAGHPAQLPQD
jgi:uncharacterized membrane protein